MAVVKLGISGPGLKGKTTLVRLRQIREKIYLMKMESALF